VVVVLVAVESLEQVAVAEPLQQEQQTQAVVVAVEMVALAELAAQA
jgi:hypothetical protein